MSYGHYHAPPRHSGYGPSHSPAPPHYGHQPAYQHHRQPAPPPHADPQLWSYFMAVDADRSGAISATELQRALVNGDWSRFDLDTVKMLMGIFDTDRSGTISFTEFAGLWKYIQDWQAVFKHFDADRSSTIQAAELAPSEPIAHHGHPPGITFDRFVRACVSVKTLTEAFQRLDTDRDGWVMLSYETFMSTVLSAP
ncbi:hypothetical protein NMY22_g6856 [Coprinellus aureogranulatus]|nr:hypothetical protein NMY22_g6856 [Coprinellus aureogranulatus]